MKSTMRWRAKAKRKRATVLVPTLFRFLSKAFCFVDIDRLIAHCSLSFLAFESYRGVSLLLLLLLLLFLSSVH